MSSTSGLLRSVFRVVAIILLVVIGVVLVLFPEPFTSALGIVLILVALAWSGWSVFRNRSEPNEETPP